MTDEMAKAKAEEAKAHAAMIESLNTLAASMIRNGANPEAIQKFVDDALDRIEAVQSKSMSACKHCGEPLPKRRTPRRFCDRCVVLRAWSVCGSRAGRARLTGGPSSSDPA